MFTLPVTTLINSPPIILRRSYTQMDILLHDNITDKLFEKHSIKNAAFNKLLTRSKTKTFINFSEALQGFYELFCC